MLSNYAIIFKLVLFISSKNSLQHKIHIYFFTAIFKINNLILFSLLLKLQMNFLIKNNHYQFFIDILVLFDANIKYLCAK